MGRSLDELPPQTRRLLLLIEEMVAAACARLRMERNDFRFSRRDVRAHTGWGDTQLKLHLHRLEELEYLPVHHGGRGQSFVYELLFEREAMDGKPMLPGLIDVETLKYDAKKSGLKGEKSGAGRGHVGGKSASGRGAPGPMDTGLPNGFSRIPPNGADTGAGDYPVVAAASGGR